VEGSTGVFTSIILYTKYPRNTRAKGEPSKIQPTMLDVRSQINEIKRTAKTPISACPGIRP
jgi:hypothetical protein